MNIGEQNGKLRPLLWSGAGWHQVQDDMNILAMVCQDAGSTRKLGVVVPWAMGQT